MQGLSTIVKQTGLAQRNEPRTSLVKASQGQLPDEWLLALGTMMDEARAFFPHQVLSPTTGDVYLQAWEELALEYGLETFRDALWRACRSQDWFPRPNQIEAECKRPAEEARLARQADFYRRQSRETARKDAEAKAIWERERDEDIAAGVPRGGRVLDDPIGDAYERHCVERDAENERRRAVAEGK